MKRNIHPGDTVRLRKMHSRRKTRAVVECALSGNYGGVKLDRPLDGFRYWNVADLAFVKRAKEA